MDENKNYELENEETAENAVETAEECCGCAAEPAEAKEECCGESCCGAEPAQDAEPAEIKKGSKIGVVIAVVAAVIVIAAAILTQTIETNPYNKLGYVDISGRTLQDIVDEQGVELADFLAEYNLPEDMPGDTIEAAAYYSMPAGTIAQMYGMDFAQLKEILKFSDDITEDSTWGDAEGSVKLSDYLGTDDIAEFKTQYGLGDDVTVDTLWKDIRNVVDEKQKEQRIEYEKEQEEAAKNGDDTAADDTDADNSSEENAAE